MKKRFLYLLLPIITLVLEILPYGAVCNFSDGPTSVLRKTFSYFSLIPFGYANFAPLITAIMTCMVLALLLVYCITGNSKWAAKSRNLLCVCVVFSFGPLVFGIRYVSVVGLLISVSLIAEILLLHFLLNLSDIEQSE